MAKRYFLSFDDEEGDEVQLELTQSNLKRMIKQYADYGSFTMPHDENGIQYHHPEMIKAVRVNETNLFSLHLQTINIGTYTWDTEEKKSIHEGWKV